MGHLQSLKLKRQIYAYEIVTKKGGNNKDYKSKIESLGMMIYNSGLVSTLTQLKLKDALIYKHLKNWIVKNKVIGFTFNEADDLLQKVVSIDDSMVLHALTIEILALTDALKEVLKAEVPS